ncbi:hypothetical protein SBA5_490067 [Candidatus Sulfotelmatomonas gaucii]|uniref:Uncharacterized protein n=1 Tax=Candidatus Sulfuritelmatomonas gaucii TaxID=2043161 RepID=A0A2N9LQC4_9BACT|nr:hypothetical protein SBA5_490067 [Candidatus Sulfotelmatomonas gaucii]
MGGETYKKAQPQEEIQFLEDTTATTSFNIEDEDDELA